MYTFSQSAATLYPGPQRGLEPESVLRLAFQSDALPTELFPLYRMSTTFIVIVLVLVVVIIVVVIIVIIIIIIISVSIIITKCNTTTKILSLKLTCF